MNMTAYHITVKQGQTFDNPEHKRVAGSKTLKLFHKHEYPVPMVQISSNGTQEYRCPYCGIIITASEDV